jgi:hypothetical protein
MAGSRKFPAPDFLERQRLDIAGVSIFLRKIPCKSLQIPCRSAANPLFWRALPALMRRGMVRRFIPKVFTGEKSVFRSENAARAFSRSRFLIA